MFPEDGEGDAGEGREFGAVFAGLGWVCGGPELWGW